MINMIRVGPVFLVLHSLKTLTAKAPAAGYTPLLLVGAGALAATPLKLT